MTRQQRPDQERSQDNGVERDTAFEATARRISYARPTTQGYLMLIAGTLLFLFSIGLLPILKWVMVAASVALIVWGAMRVRLVNRITQYIEDMRKSR